MSPEARVELQKLICGDDGNEETETLLQSGKGSKRETLAAGFLSTAHRRRIAPSDKPSADPRPQRKIRYELAYDQFVGLYGVEMSCSIVPVSRSLTMVKDVSSAAITIMMIAIRPGMMLFRL